MIQIQAFKSEGGQIYTLGFYRTTFLFPSKIQLQYLQYFSVFNQQKLGKIDIKLNISYIKNLRLKHYDYIILTHYQDILIVPYLMRKYQKAVLIGTTLMLALADIYARQFYTNIKELDRKLTNLDPFDQSINEEAYQNHFNINFKDWVGIFSLNQLQNCMAKSQKINYSQQFKTQTQLMITPYPSGYGLGSAVWVLCSMLTKQSLLWMDKVGVHKWRSCQSLVEPGLIMEEVNQVVITHALTEQTIQQLSDEQNGFHFIEQLSKRLDKSLACRIGLEDELLFLDLINQIDWKLKSKFHQIFLASQSIDQMIIYSNSYIQYLSTTYKNRIYKDPPEYPFQNYNNLKNKSYVWTGTIQQISEKQKITTKQLLIRHNPYIHFMPYYKALLQSQPDVLRSHCPATINPKHLDTYLLNFPNSYIYSFGKIQISMNYNQCQFFQTYQTSRPSHIYLKCRSNFDGMLSSYKIENNYIVFVNLSKQFLQIKPIWIDQFIDKFQKLGRQCWKIDDSSLRTQGSVVKLLNYQFNIDCKDYRQLVAIDQCLKQISKKVKFR